MTQTATLFHTTIDSPLGDLLLLGDGRALHGVHMQHGRTRKRIDPSWRAAKTPLEPVCRQLDEYFAGRRTEFDLPLSFGGTPFQQKVWHALLEIPYGETISYGELARRIGEPGEARAVGAANGRNPIAVVVPCHRVIGADGSLVGYGGGLERKRLLLDLEAGALRLELAS